MMMRIFGVQTAVPPVRGMSGPWQFRGILIITLELLRSAQLIQ